MPARAVVVLLALALLTAPVRADDAPKLTRHTSAHYVLWTNDTKAFAQEGLAALEAAWPQMGAFFGAVPKVDPEKPLAIYHLRERAHCQAVMASHGVPPGELKGGYYHPANKTVYLYRQPTHYNTRQLLLHEAMHQFHFLACCHNVGPKDKWYVEGVVEHLSRHTWDHETLRLGVLPTVSLADYPSAARKAFAKDDFDLAGMIASTRKSTRPEQWALVRYLVASGEVSAKRWKRFRKAVDAGRQAGKVFKSSFGAPKRLLPKIRAWLATQHEPLVYLWNEWQGLGARAIEGWAGVSSAVAVRVPCTEVSCTIDPPDGTPWKAGLLLHHVDNSDYTFAFVTSGGLWVIRTRKEDAWVTVAGGALEAPLPTPFRVRATRDGAWVAFFVEEHQVARVKLPAGRMGYALDNCSVRFHELAWKPAAAK